jgi:hypothetical protein
MRASYQNENQHVQEPVLHPLESPKNQQDRKTNTGSHDQESIEESERHIQCFKVSLFAGSRQRLTDQPAAANGI